MPQAPDFMEETGESRNLGAAPEFEGGISGVDPSVTGRIRQAVKLAGGFTAVVDRSDLPGRTLSRLLSGQEPKLSQLLALATATFVRLEWLASGTGPMRPSEAEVFQAGDELAGDDASAPQAVLIRRYDARASAGPATGIEAGPPLENLAFPAAFIHGQLRRDPAHLAVLECIGDSMEPTLHDGDLLLVDTARREPASGRIYVFRVDGALLAKRIQRRLDGSLQLISDNPRYPTEEFRPSASAPLDVLGEVVWRCGKIGP
jgi:phage repressor protein C with HTH and peptisase S24 domain